MTCPHRSRGTDSLNILALEVVAQYALLSITQNGTEWWEDLKCFEQRPSERYNLRQVCKVRHLFSTAY